MGKLIDLTGQQFGKWTVIKKDDNPPRKRHGAYWLCRCSCGNPLLYSIASYDLRQKSSTACKHCNWYEMIGKTYGHLTVLNIEPDYQSYSKQMYFKCQCNCKDHTIVMVSGANLRGGNVKSCGCLAREKSRERLIQDLTNQEFGYLKVLFLLDKERGKSATWHCLCKNCGNECDVTADHLRNGSTRSCGCLKSWGEASIRKVLQDNNIKYIKEKQFKNFTNEKNNCYRYDFYLPDYNRLIEFDGIQHFQYTDSGWNTKEHFEKTQKSDKIKNEYAFSHKIDIVRIPYWEKDKITLDMLLGEQYLLKRGENIVDND